MQHRTPASSSTVSDLVIEKIINVIQFDFVGFLLFFQDSRGTGNFYSQS